MIDPQELLFTVDEENNPIEPDTRENVHRYGKWHRNCHIWIVNKNQEILCQQRSFSKLNTPGRWESFFGGHVPAEVGYLDNALIELKEELGLEINKNQLKEMFLYKREDGKEFEMVYKLEWSGDLSILKLEADEVEQVRWIDLPELKRQMSINPAEWSIMGYEQKLFSLLFK